MLCRSFCGLAGALSPPILGFAAVAVFDVVDVFCAVGLDEEVGCCGLALAIFCSDFGGVAGFGSGTVITIGASIGAGLKAMSESTIFVASSFKDGAISCTACADSIEAFLGGIAKFNLGRTVAKARDAQDTITSVQIIATLIFTLLLSLFDTLFSKAESKKSVCFSMPCELFITNMMEMQALTGLCQKVNTAT